MNKLKNLMVIILLNFQVFVVLAQTHEIDSLENVLSMYTNEDTVRVNLLNETAYMLHSIDGEKSLKLAEEAVILVDKLDFKNGKAESLNIIGIYHYMKSNYPQALEYFQKSMKINEELGNKIGVASCLNNIGAIHLSSDNYEEALESFQRSLKIKEEIGDIKGIPSGLNNIGNTYMGIGNFQKAQKYYERSLKLKEELGDKKGIATSYDNIGLLYKEQSKFLEALEYLQKSLIIEKELGNKYGICLSYLNLSEVYLDIKNYNKAMICAHNSLKIAIELELIDMQKDIRFSLSNIYAAINNYKKAYENFVLYKELNDSIFNEENIKKITGLTYQYKYEKEKQAIDLEQQKKDAVHAEEKKRQLFIRNSFVVGFVLMFILVLFILRSFFQKRKTNKELSLQKNKIQTFARELEKANQTKDKFFSIIAHDLKTPFNSILGFSDLLLENHKEYDADKREQLIKYINSSSKSAFDLSENLFTWALSQSDEIQFSPKKLDFKSIVTNVILLSEGFAKGKDIELINKVNINEFVNVDVNMIRTILRNLISNSIKFTNRNGKIIVSASKNKDNGFTEVTISDTGVGMDKNQINDLFHIDKNMSRKGTENETGTGLGLILCKEFVEKHNGYIDVESTVGKGSTFIFTIPRTK